MEYGTLRGTDLVVSRIGLGCNAISAPLPRTEPGAAEATLWTAIDRGINFFDTADVYGDGAADRMLRKAFAGRRDKIVICSKAGLLPWARMKPWRRIAKRLLDRFRSDRGLRYSIRQFVIGRDFTPDSIEAAIEGTLDRLGTDHLDLFLLHRPARVINSRDDLFERLGRLKEQGKIRHYGASLASTGCSTNDYLSWLEVPGISALQVLVNPLKCVDMTRVVPAARAREVGLIARQPFHKGAVFKDRRFLDLAAANPHYTPAQVALRFGLEQDGADMVLAGFRSLAHLEDNLAALDGPGLSPDEHAQLLSMAEIV
jgi:aryl-alcohol dehydrogenase-like predicted oxidoreductase